MAKVVVTLRIMPESPDADLSSIQNKAEKEIINFAGNTEIKAKQEPIAFGLKALKLLFVMEENKGSTEELENKIKEIELVNSVETIDVRRAIG